MSPHLAPPGTLFTVALAGFTPGEPVTIHLYRLIRGVGTFWYLTSLHSPAADERGEVSFTLATRPDDPENSYC